MLRLTLERQRRGWSQAKLSHESGVNATTISLIEAGRFRPYPAQTRKLAVGLGLDANSGESLLEPISPLPTEANKSLART